ncbi:MAG: hypothetical protein A3J65_04115 [Candidatus Buchananbacteria bacterium RIFCSPHIGHO2_02_FULL_45_11b]|uniref:Hemerythrin-like domain-containing protein n=3 Tax=Candidatus Buchananiibacteriota TaxID=1817903 RepID=A0A1G1YHY3_9BACT|nr:MAG: hypothetical protein A2663_02700 [Candidatus Buchananbacteria bacterium RIFCSPHIGHO2_01_FULL_46_12]OGY51067.1 MAG: hypothetical protein A3J65_04115 [Candidatus Buchananbacteria bacterium RIFCSPHIGHO2_02_FULL_45_11b]OGY58252.1 MAG: hypothetical protein A3H67_03990 [Candidatus Buchananbacteria bacterium RIFCSPLOWO2_02_FULL_46_11b]
MATISDILSAEHFDILKVIEALEKETAKLAESRKINHDFFQKALDFIKNYADGFHHAKEEEILFREFCKNEAQMHCNPIEQMLAEHDLGRKYVKQLAAGLADNRADEIMAGARGYADLLKEHIFKEDNILYPMAEEGLSAEIKAEILNQFSQLAETKYNPEFIGRYAELIKELAANQ